MITLNNPILCEDVRGSMGVGDARLCGRMDVSVGTPTSLYHPDFDDCIRLLQGGYDAQEEV